MKNTEAKYWVNWYNHRGILTESTPFSTLNDAIKFTGGLVELFNKYCSGGYERQSVLTWVDGGGYERQCVLTWADGKGRRISIENRGNWLLHFEKEFDAIAANHKKIAAMDSEEYFKFRHDTYKKLGGNVAQLEAYLTLWCIFY